MKATDADILAALTKHNGSRTKAAAEVDLTPRAFATRVANLLRQGADVPPSPYNAPTVTGTSTLYGADGETKLKWVKEQPGKPTLEGIAAATRDALADVRPFKRIPAPKVGNKDLLAVYPIGDAHIGMYAWGEEAGGDYDLKIAESLHGSAMAHLVDKTDPADEALIVDVGDWEHYDNVNGETTKSGNRLDMDTRFHAMIRISYRVMCACIDAALAKHRRVTVIMAPGNHNDILTAARQEALALVYRANPRVSIVSKAGKFFYYEFGKSLIGVTHGDNGKPEKLAGVMAVDNAEAWGRSQYRYWYTGHVHHKSQQECMGTVWETFRILAPTDAWAHGAGYRGGREMQSITHHREFGEVARDTFNPAMLKAAA